jgi:hypothetical protein
MAERTHNEIYDRLGQFGAEIRALREIVEKDGDLSKKERREISDRVKVLEIINAERIGEVKGRTGATQWLYRVLRWTLPTLPYGALATFAVWLSHHWPWGAP